MPSRLAALLARPVVLAAIGWGLSAAAFGVIATTFFSSDRALGALGIVLFVLACAAHFAAFALDLWTTRTRRRVPFVALHYIALIAGVGLWRLAESRREAAWFREDPRRVATEIDGDALAVRTSAGVWRVPLGACVGGPALGVSHDGSGAGIGTRSHDGTVEVTFGAGDRPYMRLDVAARRVTCVP